MKFPSYGAVIFLMLLTFHSHELRAYSLKDAIEGAVATDPALRSASYNKEATRENIAVARSRLLPQVALQGTDQKLTQTTSQDTLLGRSDKTFSGPSKNYQLSLRQGLIRPREVVGLAIAQSQKESGEQKFLTELADTRVKASVAWLELLSATKIQSIYEENLNGFSKAASQEAMKYKRGDGTKDGAMEAQAQLEIAKAMLVDAQLTAESKRRNFTLVTKLPVFDKVNADFPEIKQTFLNALDREVLWQRILQTSNDLQVTVLVQEIQKARLRQSELEHLPTMDLIASYNQAQNDATSTQGLRYQNKQIGVQFTIPIYSGGGINAAERQALSVYQSSVADSEAMKQRIEADFLSLWAVQQSTVERIFAGQTAVEASSEQLKATQKAFNLGLKTWAELSYVQNSLARRSVDQVGNYLSLYRTQLKLLRMLSADDQYWAQWIEFISASNSKLPSKAH
jgi:protease secretion system outer membrane protein